MKSIYLDYAAATPLDPDIKTAMEPYLSREFFNPSATYLGARQVRQAVEQSRAKVARSLGARPAEIVFTAGATEANNLALLGVSRQFPDSKLLVSAIDHESVLAPARQLNASRLSVTKSGVINLASLEKNLTEDTVLVSLIFVSNEIGTIQPLKDVAARIQHSRQKRLASGNKLPLYFHTDATQAANFLDLSVSRLGVDLMSLNGGKIYGPKGSGCLYIKAGTKLRPMLMGGGQENGWRSGTENVAGVVGFSAALDKARSARPEQSKRIAGLRQQLEDGLTRLGGRINGGPKRAPHIISVMFPGTDNERLMFQLDEAGIQCAVGSACSAANQEPSHVLKALGLSDDLARASLRFSLGKFTTEKDIKTSLIGLTAALPRQQ
jgi:cysteine desulfurase